MKINGINNVLAKTGFKSAEPEKTGIRNVDLSKEDADKVKLCLAGLALIGAASIGSAVLKKKNIKPLNILKEKFHKEPVTDPIIKKLNGRRDAEAVKLYKGYKAQEKSASLKRKILNGDFNGKPNEVYEHLIKNEQKLERTARAVM